MADSDRLRGALVTLVRDAMRGVAYLRTARGRVRPAFVMAFFMPRIREKNVNTA